MNISILTVFPELYEQFLRTSLIGRAQEKKLININLETFFSYAQPKERIDSPTFGPGPGMLIRPDIIQMAVEAQEKRFGQAYKIFFSPQGIQLDQRVLSACASELKQKNHLMLVASRYEGMDARVQEEYADLVISLGDFVLMGGDLPAMVMLEGMLRLIPNVVGKEESVRQESFSGSFVDFPVYTAPVEWKGKKVPDVIRSGNHELINAWRQEKAAQLTVEKHFNWLKTSSVNSEEKKLAKRFIPAHYAALLHTGVLLPDNTEGTTSVTSFDIHDSARSAKTYGIEQYFIVTPLQDQKNVVQTLLDFWQSGAGVSYNPHRHEALRSVVLQDDLTMVIEGITQKEGVEPLLIATSARCVDHRNQITFYEQEKVWSSKRPILFLFGTGKGIAPGIIDRCDYLLLPIEGFSEFNHLSVRAAMSIVFDRWLGINSKR